MALAGMLWSAAAVAAFIGEAAQRLNGGSALRVSELPERRTKDRDRSQRTERTALTKRYGSWKGVGISPVSFTSLDSMMPSSISWISCRLTSIESK